MTTGFGDVAEKLRRSTVQVTLGKEGSGSGVIWDSSGLIVTNAHVARTDRAELTLWDGRKYPVQVTSRDETRDLATFQLRAPDLQPATIGDSSKLRAGELVIAVGNPLGFVGALTTGVVHTVGPVTGLSPRDYVQAAVRLAPGNSGGPLADAYGRVVGINSMVVAGGLGLAVPSNAVRDFIMRKGRRPMIGVAIRPVTVRFRSREAPGLVVLEVTPDSPAQAASLMIGDVIVGTNGRLFETFDDLSWSIEHANGPLALTFLRGDRRTLRETTLVLHQLEEVAA